MDHLLENLTDAQREAVEHVEGPLLILAGPGSGKTRVVTHRIAYLLGQGVPDRHILALTFTNKAAEEMRARVERLAPGCMVWVGTFHRFCARLLRRYAPLVGLQENYTIYDTDDSHRALRQSLAAAQLDPGAISLDSVAAAISWAKNNLILPDGYAARPGNMLGEIVARIYPAYQAHLQSCNAVDFDDLLLHVASLLRENPELRQDLDERYRFVLIDEYQDTNLAQYAIARALSIDYPNLAVTGDPDQSIYGWRGANLRNILDFEKDFPQVRVVRLERNYRSTKRILRVAADLIRHNFRRKEKSLYTENGDGQPVCLVNYPTQKEEADQIVAAIAEQIRAGQRRAGDFAIFYRVNALSRAFEFALREQGVPYQMVNGLEFFRRKEIKDILSYLQLINNPRDNVALNRVINTPTRGIGKAATDALTVHARANRLSLLEAARDCDNIPAIAKRTKGRILAFIALMDRLNQASSGAVEELMGLALTESGYQKRLEESESDEDQERLANIQELLTVAREFDERVEGEHSLQAFLEEACLVSDTDAWEGNADRVTLMTLHASKGLEFPVVYMVAVEEGLLPHERSRDREDQVEEERRLMFVGITRAQQELHLSTAQYRDFRGQRKMTVCSPFLLELPRGEMDVRDLAASLPRWNEGILPRPTAGREPRPLPAGIVAQLTTAAEMAAGATASPPVAPDVFCHGMLVRHPTYGLGRIVALSGAGSTRRATVDFTGPAGRVKFVLQQSPLRPLPESNRK